MSEFAKRFYALEQYYLRQGYDLDSAMATAVAQIQHEVRLRKKEYDTTVYTY